MSNPKKILIVDDDPDFVGAIEVLFQSSGYEVRTAVNGKEGLQQAKVFLPDLILLDVMMTERTEGFFMLQELRRSPALSRTPVIVVSSLYAEHPVFRVRPETGWLPASLFLPKPVDPGRLMEEVRKLIEAGQTQANPQTGGRRAQ